MHKVPANAFFFLFYEAFRRILRVEEAVEKQDYEIAATKRDEQISLEAKISDEIEKWEDRSIVPFPPKLQQYRY